MKYKIVVAITSLLLVLMSTSCNDKSSETSDTATDSATIQTSDDKNKESTFSSNQYANDSTVTRSDTTSGEASKTYPSNQYASDSNVIKK